MNASAVILFFLVSVLAVVFGFPAVNDDELLSPVKEGPQSPEDSTEEVGLRFPRATCDLLSVSLPIGSLNHSACAAHCLALRKGFKGGRCKDGVCHCRK